MLVTGHICIILWLGNLWEKNGKILTELSFLLSLTIKMTWEKFGSPEINLSWWDFKLKKMARAQGKIN